VYRHQLHLNILRHPPKRIHIHPDNESQGSNRFQLSQHFYGAQDSLETVGLDICLQCPGIGPFFQPQKTVGRTAAFINAAGQAVSWACFLENMSKACMNSCRFSAGICTRISRLIISHRPVFDFAFDPELSKYGTGSDEKA
jgi:hypothetical protein